MVESIIDNYKDSYVAFLDVLGFKNMVMKKKNQKLTTNNALKLLLAAESQRVLEIEEKEYFQRAAVLNLIPESLNKIFTEDRMMSRKEMIFLAAHYLDRFRTPSDLKFIRGEYFD